MGLFSENVKFCLNVVNDFRLPTSGSDFSEMNTNRGKSTTGWHAYGMLAFHPYRWSQLKSHSLACTVRIRSVLSNVTSRLIYIQI